MKTKIVFVPVFLAAAGLAALQAGCRKQEAARGAHDHEASQPSTQATPSADKPMQHDHAAGTHAEPSPAPPAPAQQGPQVFYSCPMHPSVVSDKPGKCPICGMTLQPHEKAQAPGIPGRAPVELSLAQRQLINIRTAPVVREDAKVTIRTVGIVTYDETRRVDINTKIMGWAEQLHVDKPGQPVKANDPLMDIYSPELYSAQYEYLLAYRHCERLKHLPAQQPVQPADAVLKESIEESLALVSSARKRLRLWDITETEIAALEKSGQPSETLQLRSPVSGYVIEKNIDPGQMVRPGMTLYRVADLSTVWVNADIYEFELPLIRTGQTATVTAIAYPGRRFEAAIDFIYPYTETRTRTTTVRLVQTNREGLFKPDMYLNVEIEVGLGPQLLVNKHAVFDTGKRQYVFVQAGEGLFVPRLVEVGPKLDDRLVINQGLAEGDRVVIDGNFLLDSESQLKAAGSGGAHQH